MKIQIVFSDFLLGKISTSCLSICSILTARIGWLGRSSLKERLPRHHFVLPETIDGSIFDPWSSGANVGARIIHVVGVGALLLVAEALLWMLSGVEA